MAYKALISFRSQECFFTEKICIAKNDSICLYDWIENFFYLLCFPPASQECILRKESICKE